MEIRIRYRFSGIFFLSRHRDIEIECKMLRMTLKFIARFSLEFIRLAQIYILYYCDVNKTRMNDIVMHFFASNIHKRRNARAIYLPKKNGAMLQLVQGSIST